MPAAPAAAPRPVPAGIFTWHPRRRRDPSERQRWSPIRPPQVQTGGTLYECGAKLLELGASGVSAFVAHGVFPKEAWKRFARGGDRDVFETFYVTNSIPTTTDKLPADDVFTVIDLTERVIVDLDNY